jgi:hypothetical protein
MGLDFAKHLAGLGWCARIAYMRFLTTLAALASYCALSVSRDAMLFAQDDPGNR